MAGAGRLLAAEVLQTTAYLSTTELVPGQPFRLAVVVELAPPWHANANPAALPELIPTTLTLRAPAGIELEPVVYPPGKPAKVAWADQPVALYEGRVVLFASGRVRPDTAGGPVRLEGELRYQACDDNLCYAPKTVPISIAARIAPAGTALVPQHADLFGAAPAAGATGTASSPPAAGSELGSLIERRGWLVTFLVVFLGGLALNLTPCVYPMVAITVSYFGGQGERNVRRSFASALVYCIGIVLTYSALGVVAALTGGLFGALLQSPPVLIGIALLLVALALSMFGLFEIRPPQFLVQQAAGLSSRAGWVGLFVLGAVVGIIAAPCLAPILLALLAFVGQRQDAWLGWWLFFALACGLGLPYVVLGTFSGLLARLPRSGTWMVWVKRVFGVLLLAVAVWFVLPLLKLGGASPSPIAWQPYSPAAVDAAAGRPVLIDFYADWCIPCREMDRGTFRDPRVGAISTNFVMLKADLTRSNTPAVQELSRQFQIAGVPTFVFLAANGRELTPLRQVGFVPADQFLVIMQRALASPAPTNDAAGGATTNSLARDIPPGLLNPF